MGEALIDVDANLKWLDNVCNFYAKGKEIYDGCARILAESPGSELIVSPANLGDTVFIATLSVAYKKAHGVKNLLIAAKQRQAEAAEWFEGVDGILGLDDLEMMFLRYYFTISRNYYANGIRYGHVPGYVDYNYPDTFFHIPPGFSGMSLMSVWEKRILDIPEHSETCNIRIPEGISSARADEYRNAVLIAPAAFTNRGIPDSFWEKLSEAIIQRGHRVYCNSGGLQYYKLIQGTSELVLSTKELIVNAPLFKHVIAVRSGFTDLVTKTDASMTVLHLGETQGMPLAIEYGTRDDDVRDLGRMEGIFPVLYDAEREDELISMILDKI